MLRWFLRRQVADFERNWNYDASYMHELIDTDPQAMLAFGKLQAISRYRKDVPRAALAAAGIVAVMSEDCGPCTQLGIEMAERGGVDPAVLRAVSSRCGPAPMSRAAGRASRPRQNKATGSPRRFSRRLPRVIPK